MKKILFTALFLTFVFFVTFVYAEQNITVKVNNQAVESKVKPVNIDGTIFVPLRPVAEAMGFEVIWVSGTQTANISSSTDIVSFKVGSTKAAKMMIQNPDKPIIIDCPAYPRMIGGNVYIPLRVMAEAFDATVGWDSSTQTVIIIVSDGVEYDNTKTLSIYAGNGFRKRIDGNLDSMGFLSPESMDITESGTVVVSDSGTIRILKDGKSGTEEFEPSYIVPDIVRTCGEDIYFTTQAFENEGGEKYCGIVKLTNGIAEGIFLTDAVFSRIDDFDVDKSGNIYALYYNAGVNKKYLSKISDNDITHLIELDEGFGCICADNEGGIYIGNTVKGSIYRYSLADKTLKLFAGVDGKTSFVDGKNPMLFEPRSMFFSDGSLYVLDYNLVRRFTLYNGQLVESKTIAGKVTAEPKPKTVPGKASETEIAPNYSAEIAVSGGKVYLTDPVNDYVYTIE